MPYAIIFTTALLFVTYRLVWFLLRKLTVSNISQRYVLVTGCDSGFGNLLAKRLDAKGMHVFATCYGDIETDNLRETCSRKLVAFTMDVAKETSIENGVRTVEKHLPNGKGLWAVINNAGVVSPNDIGPATWQTRAEYATAMEVNLYGVAMVTTAFFPMVEREKGRIVIMSSILGTIALKGAVSYIASKFAVEGYGQCLRYLNQ